MRCGLGSVLGAQGRLPEAESLLREGVATQRKALGDENIDLAWSLQDLGLVLEHEGKLAEAERLYFEVLEIRKKLSLNPRRFLVEHLTDVLRLQGKLSEQKTTLEAAADAFRNAANSGDIEAENDIAWLLATCREPGIRDGEEAVRFAEKVVSETGRRSARFLDTLAAAYAEAGEFEKAVITLKEALALPGNEEQKQGFASRLKLYEANTP
jgi:tetratricopeptide (TPR) repeat protein